MGKCSYILETGKECKNKTYSNLHLCQHHQINQQQGGGLTELIYPMGKSIGFLTFSLFRLNEMFQSRIDRKKGKYNKKANQDF